MQISKLILLVHICLLSWGCSRQDVSLDKCALSPSYKVNYLGASSGDGELKFSNSENGLNYQIKIFDSFVGVDKPILELGGIAKCSGGIVFGAIGTGNSSKPSVKIMGGSFTGIFNEPLIERPFGKWTLSLHDAELNKDYHFTGFWELN